MKTRVRSLWVACAILASIALLAVSVSTAPADRIAQRFAVSSGRVLRQWDETISGMERARELRLRDVQQDTLITGRQFERLDQYYEGVRVFGGQAVRETDGKTVLSITASLYPRPAIDTTPVLEPTQALAIFVRETEAASPLRATPELVILPRDDGSFVLAYRVSAFVKHALPVLFIDAKTGAVELRYDNLQTQQPAAGIGTGIYGDEKKVSATLQGGVFLAWDQMRPTKIVTNDLRGDVNRAMALEGGLASFVASDMATSSSAQWSDPVVVDAHAYLGWTYDYFFKRFAWKGFDNHDGRPVQAMVHPVRRADLEKYAWSDVGDYFVNASFCPQCGASNEDVLMFGEGLPTDRILTTGQSVTYMAASLDTVAHEYAHGVSDYSANLVYRNESGALSEAFSDIMSTGVEFFFEETGSGPLKADYLQGEESFLKHDPQSLAGIRSLADPAAFGDPDHYSKRYTGTDDRGGVHTNSAIPGHVFYLAIEGGTNRTSGLQVHGVGAANREQIEKVFFRGFVTLPADATFSLARARTIQSAKDLYPSNAAVERAVTEAWTAAGVQ